MLQNTIRTLRECLAHLEQVRDQKRLTMAEAFASGVHPFDCDLVSVPDLAKRFGVSKDAVVDFLRLNGAVKLPRTTQGGGVPAITLWAVRDQERLMKQSARARVDLYHAHHSAFDPLEL